MDMTKREFLTAVAALNGPDVMSVETLNTMADYAKAALDKMEVAAEKRKGYKTEKQKAASAEKDEIAKMVAKEFLTTEARTATDVMELMNAKFDGAEPYKVQSVSAILVRAVKLGAATMVKVKIPKKGTQNGYLAVED